MYEHPGQELEIELFDEDPDKDDFLGRWKGAWETLWLLSLVHTYTF